jgi:ribonuclease G
MSKEIIVNKGKQTLIAIVENGELAELFIENQEHERTIGNIFLGRIRRVMPSIQAAFVDIGQKQDAFLHFSDLIDNVESWLAYAKTDQAEIGTFKGDYTTKPAGKKRRHPDGQHRGGRGGERQSLADQNSRDRRKSARDRQHSAHESRGSEQESEEPLFDPTRILVKDQPILVKISKEPIANKGSRITTDISLAGRFLVLVPMANYVAVSKKIMSFKERRRLRALARSLLPEGFGVIVRTVAEGRSAKALDTDLNLLVDKWKKIEAKLKSNPKPPAVIHEDVNMVSSIMRDLFTEDYDRILIDDPKLYRNIRGYVQAIAPDMVEDVKLEENAESVFQKVGIKAAVEEAFDERVNMPSGGYLFFEQTEAMHVVDVNSGRAGRGMSQEDSSLKVNLEAAKIICKQVRLRDLGGIIVVDFIDMRHESNRRKLYETLKKEFRADRAVTKVLPMSDFGLIQITRQRLRPSITKTFSLPDDQASGAPAGSRSGRKEVRDRTVEPSHLHVEPEDLLRKIEEWLTAYRDAGNSARVRLKVHPFTASFLSGKFPSRAFRWRLRFGVKVQIEADPSVDPMSFRFFDGSSGKEISRLSPRSHRKAHRKPPSDKKKDTSAKGGSTSESGSSNREGGSSRSGSRGGSSARGRSNRGSGSRRSETGGRGRPERSTATPGRGRKDDSGGKESREERSGQGQRGRQDERSRSGQRNRSTERSRPESRDTEGGRRSQGSGSSSRRPGSRSDQSQGQRRGQHRNQGEVSAESGIKDQPSVKDASMSGMRTPQVTKSTPTPPAGSVKEAVAGPGKGDSVSDSSRVGPASAPTNSSPERPTSNRFMKIDLRSDSE